MGVYLSSGGGVYLLSSAFGGGFSWGGLAAAIVMGAFTGGMSALAGGAGRAGAVVINANGAALGGTTKLIVDEVIEDKKDN
ncbi:MAG: hypothetical protein ACJAS9_003435 [Polaribacter sp.]|jgi:hypothetical protein